MDSTEYEGLATHRGREHHISPMGEYIKQIVYGGNDGIVTTFAIVAGFAGAGAGGVVGVGGVAVLLFGLANLFADASAMGLGEFLSARSEQNLYHDVRAKELQEIEQNPEMERLETLEILAERGFTSKDASDFADILAKYPDYYADFMMSYEIQMADPQGENPVLNGLVTFIAFIIFGAIPLVPYFIFEPNSQTFIYSVGATFGALTLLGLLQYWVIRSKMLLRIFETVSVGGICALVAYCVGLLFG